MTFHTHDHAFQHKLTSKKTPSQATSSSIWTKACRGQPKKASDCVIGKYMRHFCVPVEIAGVICGKLKESYTVITQQNLIASTPLAVVITTLCCEAVEKISGPQISLNPLALTP